MGLEGVPLRLPRTHEYAMGIEQVAKMVDVSEIAQAEETFPSRSRNARIEEEIKNLPVHHHPSLAASP